MSSNARLDCWSAAFRHDGSEKNLNSVIKKSLRRVFGLFGYAVIRARTYQRMLDDARELGVATHELQTSKQQLSAVEAQANALRAERDALQKKSITGDDGRDYQLLMAYQDLIASLRDLDPGFGPLVESVKPYTMTSVERLYDLYKSVEYIVKAQVPGDLLECGVWKGGSMMLVAKTLCLLGDTTRTLYLLDTFEGHPKPDSNLDRDMWGNVAHAEWVKHRKSDDSSDWAYIPLEQVRENMAQVGYPMDKVRFVKGMVEQTAASVQAEHFALLRLDTDWYASARASLEAFWPRLVIGGVLIVDDYGHYQGQRKAVDEYFASSPVLLHRVDYSCRSIVKTS